MKKSFYLTYCLFLLLIGCNGTSGKLPILGEWVTETCEQSVNKNGEPQNIWLKGFYQFTAEGEIFYDVKTYEDSNCVTLKTEDDSSEANISASYQDNGPTLLQEGISGRKILIDFNAGIELISIDAFYTINENTLCFSEAYTFEASTFGASELSSDEIDFNNCLVRP